MSGGIWKYDQVGTHRWSRSICPDFIYIVVTDGQKRLCFYALWDAAYEQATLEKFHNQIEKRLQKMLSQNGMELRVFRVETFMAGYDVKMNEIKLYRQGGQKSEIIPPILYKWFHDMLSPYAALPPLKKVS